MIPPIERVTPAERLTILSSEFHFIVTRTSPQN
jgi:hypothetical protein